jgi:uncharacterized protein (DUF885 family)
MAKESDSGAPASCGLVNSVSAPYIQLEKLAMKQLERFLFAALAIAYACAGSGAASSSNGENNEAGFAALEREYVTYVLGQFPVISTYLDGGAFDPRLLDTDGRLRNYSPEALLLEQAQLANYRERFNSIDAAHLRASRGIDRDVALAQINFLLHEQRVRRYQQRSLDSYINEPFRGIDWQVQAMMRAGSTYGTRAEWHAVLARTRSIPAYLVTAEKQLAAGVAAGNTPDWRMLVEGLKTAEADAAFFAENLPQQASNAISVAPGESGSDLRNAGNDAALAYRHLRDFLIRTFFDNPAAHDALALKPNYRADRFSLGAAEYNWALSNNLRAKSNADELFKKSYTAIQETRGSLISLALAIGTNHQWSLPTDSLGATRTVFDRLTLDAPRNDDEMVEAYVKSVQHLIQYARDTRLFDVPANYGLELMWTPASLATLIDGAAYYPGAPFSSTYLGRFYVTPTNDNKAELQLHSFASMAALVADDVFPGHDLHYKTMVHYNGTISPIRWLTPGAVEDSSSMWQNAMAIEGWGAYATAVLAEPRKSAPHGLYSPEEYLFLLRGELLQNLQVRIDTGIHTGRLQFNEAVTLYSETVDFLPGSCLDPDALEVQSKRVSCERARSAVTRFALWPTWAVTSQLGKEQILALRQRAQNEMRQDLSLEAFHLELMAQGAIPVPYFAKALFKALKY